MSETREWISFRVKAEEYIKIEELRKESTCRSLSEYARKVLLANPVIIKYRNESADHFLSEMVLLKRELNAAGHNFNQAVKRLHTLDTLPQMRSWLLVYEATHKSFISKVEEIKERLVQIHELWSQL